MRRMTIVAALAAGLLLGCKPQQPPTPTPAPEPTPKARATAGTAGDDMLSTSGPPRTPAPTFTPAPTATPTPASQPAGAARKYTVKLHDTLFSIARDQLKDQHRVGEIKTLNPGITSWDSLKVGQEILIPAK